MAKFSFKVVAQFHIDKCKYIWDVGTGGTDLEYTTNYVDYIKVGATHFENIFFLIVLIQKIVMIEDIISLDHITKILDYILTT